MKSGKSEHQCIYFSANHVAFTPGATAGLPGSAEKHTVGQANRGTLARMRLKGTPPRRSITSAKVQFSGDATAGGRLSPLYFPRQYL
jgi:hypothetical protein